MRGTGFEPARRLRSTGLTVRRGYQFRHPRKDSTPPGVTPRWGFFLSGAYGIASFLVGLGVLVAWRLTPLGEVLHEVFPALALSLAAYVLVALHNNPPHAPHRVEVLFRRAHRRARRRARR